MSEKPSDRDEVVINWIFRLAGALEDDFEALGDLLMAAFRHNAGYSFSCFQQRLHRLPLPPLPWTALPILRAILSNSGLPMARR